MNQTLEELITPKERAPKDFTDSVKNLDTHAAEGAIEIEEELEEIANNSLILYNEEMVAMRNVNGKALDRYPDEWGIRAVKKGHDGKVVLVEKEDDEYKRAQCVLDRISKNRNTKHHLYSQIPLICPGSKKCPFSGCEYIEEKYVNPGDRCPIEIADVLDLVDSIYKRAGIKQGEPEYAIDEILVRDIVYNCVLIKRIEAYVAKEGIIKEVVIGATQQGEPILTEDINKALNLRDKLLSSNMRLEEKLQITRKDAEDVSGSAMDEFISGLIRAASDRKQIIDVKKGDEGNNG